jgi:hypothetical protein
MSKLGNKSFEFNLKNPLHIVSLHDMPGIATCRLRHRQQQIFIEIFADSNRRGTHPAFEQAHCLRNNLIAVGETDVCESIREQDHAIDANVQQPFADS